MGKHSLKNSPVPGIKRSHDTRRGGDRTVAKLLLCVEDVVADELREFDVRLVNVGHLGRPS